MAPEGKQTRVWIDGCFDMVHFGHANVLRQAKALGDYLIVGVHSDEEITQQKGPPVFSEAERYAMVRAIKWVDEVVEGAPYITHPDTLKKHNCDFAVHGDDVSITADGKDAYETIKKSKMYKEVSRTQGVSTTDIVGRMLLLTRNHHKREGEDIPDKNTVQNIQKGSMARSPYTGVSQFLATTQKIVQFSSGKNAQPGDRIVYVAGSFDCFHIGHLRFLEKARKYGDYVIVGLHTDSEVNRYIGSNYPIMNVHERVLSVLACKYVHEVVIGAPFSITDEMMSHFKIDMVVHGGTNIYLDENGVSPYLVADKQGKFTKIESGDPLTTPDLVERIIKNREIYIKRNKAKEKKELNHSNGVSH